MVNITKHSKLWWNENCKRHLGIYRASRHLEDWKNFKKTVKSTKREFFDAKIQEISNNKKKLWELINWIKKQKLPAIEAIKYNGQPCLEINNLWQALYESFNSTQHQQVNTSLLEEIPNKITTKWPPFLKEEFLTSINKCSNDSTPGPDKLSWRHLKVITKNLTCLVNIMNIANACINLGDWPSHFKLSMSIIISKLNKALYDISKMFRPIVLLNLLSKLIEKVIGKRLQFQALSKNTIHSYQLECPKKQSMTDTSIVLIHLIHIGWVKNCSTNMLVFNIT